MSFYFNSLIYVTDFYIRFNVFTYVFLIILSIQKFFYFINIKMLC